MLKHQLILTQSSDWTLFAEEAMISKLEQTHQKNSQAIKKVISGLSSVSYNTVSQLIPNLLKHGALVLDPSAYIPDAEAKYPSKFLIYDHPDKENPFSIWVFAFTPRQKTVIHDHRYKGSVTVLQGPISEKYYQPTGKNAHTAFLVSQCDRHRFHTNQDNLDDTFVHRLKRRKGLGEGISVTLHIYNMGAFLINQEGKKMDRRNLNTIYSKVQSLDTQSLPYDQVYCDNFLM